DDGPGLLSAFSIRIDAPSPAETMSRQLLRKLRLKMYWDGEKTPSVDVPLGDFFCNPFYYREYSSMPLGRVNGAFICRFPMPYQAGARCELVNLSDSPVAVSMGVSGNHENTNGLERRFHAAWSASNRSGYPLKILKTSGAGHYVGCFLTAIGQDGTWTILEGDEFLRPDPGKQPPQLGTGLEDYFNGAYYYTSLFDLPLHGLIEKGAMRTDQYRLHMLDAVPFNEHFEAGIEFGDRNQAQGYMSSIAYWYADKAAPMPLPSWQEQLLAHPPDRFELSGLMSSVFMLERDGLYADAASRMEYFAVRYQQQPWVDVLKVRVLGYREKSEGFDAVKEEYLALASSSYPPAARAAKDRLWLEEDSSHALLGIHALAQYTLLLDGKPVAAGTGTGNLEVHRLSITPGSHVWQVELEPTRQGSFFSLCLRTAYGDVTSAGEWEEVSVVELAGRTRPESFEGREVLPNMTLWAFEPTAYVDMQSAAAGIKLWSFWDSKPLIRRLVLEKNWVLGETATAPAEIEQDRDEEELRAHAID
ncbi:MAG TPA: glycoside hydrolase family 172 protein, partial [Pontiella sp.]|nr:glycoside hydrolase family 172 protein [Pontiella sp.]